MFRHRPTPSGKNRNAAVAHASIVSVFRWCGLAPTDPRRNSQVEAQKATRVSQSAASFVGERLRRIDRIRRSQIPEDTQCTWGFWPRAFACRAQESRAHGDSGGPEGRDRECSSRRPPCLTFSPRLPNRGVSVSRCDESRCFSEPSNRNKPPPNFVGVTKTRHRISIRYGTTM